MEEYAYILDIIVSTKGSLAYLIGVDGFTFLTATIKQNTNPKIGEKYYIGKIKEKREVIDLVKERITFQDLNERSKSNLREVLKKIVIEKENEYLNFLNNAKPINARTHMLEFLPQIGKKTLKIVIDNRPYQSFEDFKKKTGLDPVEILAEKLYRELSGRDMDKLLTLKILI